MTASDIRRHAVIHIEGQILACVSSLGLEGASSHARCVADGAVNAISRLEGAETAAGFAYAMADRLVGGIKLPTDVFAPPVQIEAGPVEEAEADPPPPPLDTRADVPWWLYYAGMAVALIAGIVIGMGMVR